MKYYPPFGATDPNASYTNGNAAAGIKGSIPPAEGIEHPLREIVAVIAAAGLTPDENDLTQLLTAINTLIAAQAVMVGSATELTSGIVRLATAEEVAAGVENDVAVSPANLHEAFAQHVVGWVNFNSSGALSVRGSYNVASVDDLGTGSHRVNFTQPLAPGYSWALCGSDASAGFSVTTHNAVGPLGGAPISGSFTFATGNTENNTAVDYTHISAVFFGEFL